MALAAAAAMIATAMIAVAIVGCRSSCYGAATVFVENDSGVLLEELGVFLLDGHTGHAEVRLGSLAPGERARVCRFSDFRMVQVYALEYDRGGTHNFHSIHCVGVSGRPGVLVVGPDGPQTEEEPND